MRYHLRNPRQPFREHVELTRVRYNFILPKASIIQINFQYKVTSLQSHKQRFDVFQNEYIIALVFSFEFLMSLEARSKEESVTWRRVVAKEKARKDLPKPDSVIVGSGYLPMLVGRGGVYNLQRLVNSFGFANVAIFILYRDGSSIGQKSILLFLFKMLFMRIDPSKTTFAFQRDNSPQALLSIVRNRFPCQQVASQTKIRISYASNSDVSVQYRLQIKLLSTLLRRNQHTLCTLSNIPSNIQI